MNYNVIPIERFKKEAKKLFKKFPSLKNELFELAKMLSKNPMLGTSLGDSTFKIRIAIKSKGKGKSGGARIITYIIAAHKEIYLLTVYDKSEFGSIDDKTLKKIIKDLRGKT